MYCQARAGPQRVYSSNGSWYWREAREAFIRSFEACRYDYHARVSIGKYVVQCSAV